MIAETEILHMVGTQFSKTMENLCVAVENIRLSHGKVGIKMSKYYIIIAHDGTEVIDSTVEAEDRIAAMDYMEGRYKRECRRRNNTHSRFARNPLFRLASLCGMV